MFLNKFTDELLEIYKLNKDITGKLSEAKELIVCLFTKMSTVLMHTSIKQSGLLYKYINLHLKVLNQGM